MNGRRIPDETVLVDLVAADASGHRSIHFEDDSGHLGPSPHIDLLLVPQGHQSPHNRRLGGVLFDHRGLPLLADLSADLRSRVPKGLRVVLTQG